MIEELCLSGGVQRGICELGSIKAMEENNILIKKKLKKVVGVSIGALVLCSYIIGFSIEEIMDIILETDTSLFNDVSLGTSYSILRGQTLKNWVLKILKEKNVENFTVKEFYNKYGVEFITSAVSLETGLEYISYVNYPNMLLIDQIISSMALPLIFPPVVTCSRTFIDGGILDNFPIHLLKKNDKTLGILIKTKHIDDIEYYNEYIFNYLKKLFNVIHQHINKIPDDYNIVKLEIIDNNSINFNLNIDQKINYYKQGYNLTKKDIIYKKFNSKVMYNSIFIDYEFHYIKFKYMKVLRELMGIEKIKKIIK